MFGLAKKILFWSYGRTSWQYDVLCALILAFIFLTPPVWFKTGEPATTPPHQIGSKAADRVFISSESLPPNPGASDLRRRASEEVGRPEVNIKRVAPLKDGEGRTVAFEVDIE